MELIPAKTIITKTKSSQWFGADYNMNIYRGCTHGCIYCDSRSDCYQNKEFDTIKAKADALKIIRSDLRRKVTKGVISTGAMSDPYNIYEEKEKLTQNALTLIDAYGFGVAIATKSPLISRDIDILKQIKSHSPVIAKLTITAYDDELSRKIEPNVAASSQRFRAIRELGDAGIFAGILMMPILPYVNDNIENITNIVKCAADSGARFIYPAFGLTMRDGQREYFLSRLDALYPGLAKKYMSRYGTRYSCSSPHARKLYEEFQKLCSQYNILFNMSTIITHYKYGYNPEQLSLF